MADIIDVGATYVKEKLKNGLIWARFFLPSPPSWKYIDGKWIGGESYRAVVDKLKVSIVYKGSPDWHRKTNIIHQDKRVVADKYFLNKTAYFSPRLYLDGKEILPKSGWKIGASPNRLEMDYEICKHILQLRHGEILDWWVFEKNPEGDVLIQSNLQKDTDIKIKKPFAISELSRIDIETKNGNKFIPKKVFGSVAYPFFVDDTVTFYTSSSDGRIYSSDSPYSNARTATSGTVRDTEDEIQIGQYYFYTYYIYRSFLFFDTSSIPSNATITAASLHLYDSGANIGVDFDIIVQNGQPTYPHEPLEDGDFYYSYYSGNGGSWNTVNHSTGEYKTINLNSDGISWIQKGSGAKTKLCLRSSRDINGNEPSGGEYIFFYTSEKGNGYQPYLEVTYSTATTYTKTFTTDGIIENIVQKNFTTDADIKGTVSKTATTDAQIVERKDKNLSTDGYIRGTVTKGFTTDANILLPTYLSISFNKYSLYKAIQNIADLTLASFYIDGDGDFWFYRKDYTTSTGITIDYDNYISASGLTDQDFSQLYNAVKVVGGKVLSEKEDEFTGDGSTTVFKLSRTPVKDLLVTVDDVDYVGGIRGVDSCSSVDYLYDPDTNEIYFCTAPNNGADIVVTYKTQVTLTYYAEDSDSIEQYGRREHEPIVDEQILSYEMLVYKGQWLLENYAQPQLQGSITVDIEKVGSVIKAGDLITINLPRYDMNNEEVRVQSIEYKITPSRITATIKFVKKKDLTEFLGRVFDKIEQLKQALTQTGPFESDTTYTETESVSPSVSFSDNSPPYYWGDDSGGAYVDKNIVEDDNVYG